MEDIFLRHIVLILALGVLAQWLAWRLKVPSILLLLSVGFLAGPVFGFIQPDSVMGEGLMPLVSLSVGIILFEGGLTLKFREWGQIGKVVRNLLLVGAFVTWVLSSIAAKYCLGWNWDLSILFGAVLVVTGPTVILPLLRHVRPAPSVGNILKWEGILIDPVGALLALLVFEAIIAKAQFSEFSLHVVQAFGLTFIVGMGLGWAGAQFLLLIFRKHLVPEFLDNSVTLMSVVGIFTAANAIQHEAGLLAVTIMGVFLANQNKIDVHHIIDFKENLRTLLIASLFIILSARLTQSDIQEIDWGRGAIFLLCMLFIVRPISVFLSTIGSKLNIKEKVFLSWLAPRGIVAAAVASLFSLKLQDAGVEGASQLVPSTFLVIVGTVLIYGLTSLPLAKVLGLSNPDPQGVILLGSSNFTLAFAEILHRQGLPVLLVDTNRNHLKQPRLAGIPTYHGNILDHNPEESMDLQSIGYLMACTRNDEVNSLAALNLKIVLGKDNVFQLPPVGAQSKEESHLPDALSGRFLFGPGLDIHTLELDLARGAVIKATKMTEEFTFDQFVESNSNESENPPRPMAVLKPDGKLQIWGFKRQPVPEAGDLLIHLSFSETEKVNS